MEHSFVSISTNKRTRSQPSILRVAAMAVAERTHELGLFREYILNEAAGSGKPGLLLSYRRV